MKQSSIKKNNDLLNIAKILRRNMTKQERKLWYDFLQHYPVKIYKQRIIGNYIADFYCHEALLVIELDGAGHFTRNGIAHDKERTEFLENHGLQVLRFSNRLVDDNFEGVCHLIDKTIKDRINSQS